MNLPSACSVVYFFSKWKEKMHVHVRVHVVGFVCVHVSEWQ